MNGKPFLDTNVLIYAFTEGDTRSRIAMDLLSGGGVIGVQVLNEFAAVARRKLGFSWEEIGDALAAIRILCPSIVPLSQQIHERALNIARGYGYRL